MRWAERGVPGWILWGQVSGFQSVEMLRALKTKKCGIEIGDPNLRFQSRLPGSVVGEASMAQVEKVDKITEVTVLG
jgi:hypothetical protein